MEPWMSPNEWLSMGGEFCPSGDCSTCRQSEWSLAKYLGQEKTNEVFKKHWETWLTQEEVDGMVAAGLNTIRIPLGFWIIEDIVDRSDEPYAEGGLDELIRGLELFKDAGMHVVLDHHALPGVSSSGQMFAGNCTTQVEFYDSPNDYNYKRAVTWSIVMAWLSHTHPAFETVFSIEAINEPLQDANLTPNLGKFEKSFVLGVRAIEYLLGIQCDDTFVPNIVSDSIAFPALLQAFPIIERLSKKYDIGPFSGFNYKDFKGGLFEHLCRGKKKCLSTMFMNKDWQYNSPANPADVAHGPQVYDNHLYFNFGGVAPNATEESYMETLCNTAYLRNARNESNTPIVTGEWSLAVAFNTTNHFLKKWGDAQKLAYGSNGASGWMFWSWKIAPEAQTYPIPNTAIQWTYKDALAAGLFTQDPNDVFDRHVCDPYVNKTATA
ncbi:glycoside hydrolase family 5 protein [Botryobasidium botryosum FD-172 SS1]|uniref:Glycoside hydrolase family 5 protein n=1 Tax=Botryobasidium botryosum (strain FD-172 SS1) TaxID=930990 RepID=A0A067LW11_BOTB1|nr:glycoside hydrolase family 5 protein [Botryobasidium botryosum FD-172 SS1]